MIKPEAHSLEPRAQPPVFANVLLLEHGLGSLSTARSHYKGPDKYHRDWVGHKSKVSTTRPIQEKFHNLLPK